jgi:hypothetical protein
VRVYLIDPTFVRLPVYLPSYFLVAASAPARPLLVSPCLAAVSLPPSLSSAGRINRSGWSLRRLGEQRSFFFVFVLASASLTLSAFV